MADNTVLNAGTAGDTIRDLARQAGTIKTQVVQLDIGGVTANAEVLVTAGQQTAANSVPVVIASNQPAVNVTLAASQLDITNNYSSASTGQLPLTAMSGVSNAIFVASGFWVANIVFEASLDGTTFFAINAVNVLTGAIIANTTANGTFVCNVAGCQQVRARVSSITSGTVVIVGRTGSGINLVTLDSSLPAGTNSIGIVTQQPITKNVQSANGITTQDLKDSGRNQSNLFMAAQVISTATDTLQSLTGYKSGAAVAATTTPAVVTAAKTYRLNRVAITYVAVITAGAIQVNLHANTSGVVVIGSPIVDSWLVGGNMATAGVAETIVIDIPDGMEFAAGTGIGVSVQGFSAIGVATAVGYAKVSLSGYEY